MNTAHLKIPANSVKNLRTDIVLDDGTSVQLSDGDSCQIQARYRPIRVATRATARGAPTTETEDFLLLEQGKTAKLVIENGFNHYAWTCGPGAVLSVGDICR